MTHSAATRATFAGQRAVVTGASSGIGRSIALELGARGAAVWLVARRGPELERVADEIRRNGGSAQSCVADLSRDDELRRFALQLGAHGSGVDALVHCAGIHHLGPIAAAPLSELDDMYRVNVRAPYAITQLLLPQLRASRGQVVFVNSTLGLQARAHVGAYAATKHALRAVADSLREEVNAVGIRVVSVYVGRTATPGQEAIHTAEGRPYAPATLLQPSDVAEVVAQALAMPRTAEVTDIRVRPMQKPSA